MKTLDADRACRRCWPRATERDSVYFVDVRTREEYEAGHIPGFWWFPGGQVVQRSDDAIGVRNGTVVLSCDGIARAARPPPGFGSSASRTSTCWTAARLPGRRAGATLTPGTADDGRPVLAEARGAGTLHRRRPTSTRC